MRRELPRKTVYNNFNYLGPLGEINTMPSKTVPSTSLPLNELINRYVRGQVVPTMQPVYNGDIEDFPDITRLDPIERIELARKIRDEYIAQTRELLAQRIAAEQAKLTDPATIFNETGIPVKEG